MDNNIFKGLFTALLTPFKDNRIDFMSLEKMLEYQIKSGVDGIVIAGSTGEGVNLDRDEYIALLQEVVDITKKRILIIAGCNATYTIQAVNQVLEAQKIPIDGLMCTTPYYTRPTQEGLYQHFKAIHDIAELPIILYSVPIRTGVDFTDDTIFRLSELPKIIAFKDAGRDLERTLRISAKVKGDFALLSGNDEVSLAYNAQGGVGCISVVSNIAPKLCKDLQERWKKGHFKSALKIHQQLVPLYKALFMEVNPIGIKYAAQYLGICSGELRFPLTEANFDTRNEIERALKKLALG
ncbi:4-hydroxy-tetrahydrodipicolinate synthase [Candidatus Trichorickettsia mobilis]|uniref:4-hydroxy-tetrahydrodipicolinate synthase n=1 Tax=Candidatus Trichorickettsia mobilis TaxID=1346319 RepID=UPI002B25B548|nr:4-hydroxy-tetrahydrodipicolinate synthase [Candidatus Trichorickettsia mobilis]